MHFVIKTQCSNGESEFYQDFLYAFLLRQFFGNFWVLPIEEYCLWWIFGSGILNSDFRHCGQNWPFSVLKPSNLGLFILNLWPHWIFRAMEALPWWSVMGWMQFERSFTSFCPNFVCHIWCNSDWLWRTTTRYSKSRFFGLSDKSMYKVYTFEH